MSKSTAVKERLSAKNICERRDEIIALITQAVEKLGEAELLLKTIYTYGFSLDRDTFYDVADSAHRIRSISSLTKQVDKKIWNHIIELGEFRELMSINEQRKINEQLENVPPVTYETVVATFSNLLNNKPNMLRDLVETAFLERNKDFKNNQKNKIGRKHIIAGVFDRYGFSNHGSYGYDRLEDMVKAMSKLTGFETPYVTSILREQDEYLAFNDAVRFNAFQNGNVHITILDQKLLDRLNDVLANAMGAKIGSNA